MKILSKKETGMGGSWILADYGNNFFAYGYIQDSERFLNFPVDQCGSKKKVLAHCNLIARMCEQNIKRYQKKTYKRGNTFNRIRAKTIRGVKRICKSVISMNCMIYEEKLLNKYIK